MLKFIDEYVLVKKIINIVKMGFKLLNMIGFLFILSYLGKY